jgi:hypothetical protein
MVAIATARAVKFVSAVIVIYLLVVAGLAALFHEGETFGKAFFEWAWRLPAFLVAWAALEGLGTWLFNRPWINRLSSGARICVVAAGTVAIICLVIAAFYIVDAYAL